MDSFTSQKLNQIKNPIFLKNVFDTQTKKIVKNVRLKKINSYGKNSTPLVWEYYKNRAKINVNDIIQLYQRENLIITYSIDIT